MDMKNCEKHCKGKQLESNEGTPGILGIASLGGQEEGMGMGLGDKSNAEGRSKYSLTCFAQYSSENLTWTEIGPSFNVQIV